MPGNKKIPVPLNLLFRALSITRHDSPLELLYFALAIVALSVGLYFTGKVGKH